MSLLQKTLDSIEPLDEKAMERAQARLDSLLKPPGSLGRLESVAVQLAGITGNIVNRVQHRTIIVMCADNGVTAEGVTSFPREVSRLVAETMLKGIAGVAVLARHANARLIVVDVGLEGTVEVPGIMDRKVRHATANMAHEPAMSRAQCLQAIETGIEITNDAIAAGADIIGTGEVGIGNTTTSSAVLLALTGASAEELVGRGAGLSDEGLQHKREIVRAAVARHAPDPRDPVDVVSKVGGLDIAGLMGCYLAAAANRVPVVIDGFIAGAAAVAAAALHPEARAFMIPSHASGEPGARVIARTLAMEPMLNMGMRLGEGTGCALAFPVIEAAARVIAEMGTFADIGM